MKVTILLLLLALTYHPLQAKLYPVRNKLINKKMVDELRSKNLTWTVYEPEESPLSQYNDTEIMRVLGMPGIDFNEVKRSFIEYKDLSDESTMSNGLGKSEVKSARSVSLPASFDWRTSNGACMPPVQDQGRCGSCYAFSAATVFSARRCALLAQSPSPSGLIIHSPQDLLSCNIHTKRCDGGIIDLSFRYFEDFGIVTQACQPYLERSNSGSGSEECRPNTCSASGQIFQKVYCKRGSSVIIYGRDRIKHEILTNGPVATFMEAFADLSLYSGGIYRHSSGASAGGHAVVIVGWGSSNNINFWIVKNSWGSSWGESGYFRSDMNDEKTKLGQSGMYCIPEV